MITQIPKPTMGLPRFVVSLLFCIFPMRSEGGLYFRCPLHSCLCESGDMGLVMNCRQRFLTRIPPVIASDLFFHEISLKKNNIRHLGPQAFKGIKVKKIDLSENIITSIDEDAFDGVEDMLEELAIQVYNMKGLPLKALHKLNRLKVLHVIGCKVPVLTNSTFSSLSTLEEIRLISCGIELFEPDAFLGVEKTLKVLDFYGNNLKTVPSTALVGLESVEKMVLTGNRLKTIEEKSLLGMASLRHLELSSNAIYSIHPRAFDGIQTSLEFLGLQRNRLTANDLVALRILRNLNQLELAYNQIEDIPRRLFQNLNRVTLIGLQSNKIQGINRMTFAGTERQLKVLLLSDNDVNLIAPDTFLGFRRLRHLYLDRTNAGNGLSRHSFRGLGGSLETLNMQRSGFTASGFVAISDLSELKTLVLRDNQITSLLPRVFTKSRRLTRLDLQGNKLQSITNPETFQGLEKSLRQLVLSNNMINTLSECVFEKFEQLRDIVLNQNPLQCDCQILWLKRWVMSKTSTFSRNTLNWICAGPREHAGKLFRAVKGDEMVCPEGTPRDRCPSSEQVPLVTTPITTELKSPPPSTHGPILTKSTLVTKIIPHLLDIKFVEKSDVKDDNPKMRLLLPNGNVSIFNQDSFYNDIIQRTVQLMASKIHDSSRTGRPRTRGNHRFKQPLNKLVTTPSRNRKRTLARWLSSTRKMYTKPTWTSRRPSSRRKMITRPSFPSSNSPRQRSERVRIKVDTTTASRRSVFSSSTTTITVVNTSASVAVNSETENLTSDLPTVLTTQSTLPASGHTEDTNKSLQKNNSVDTNGSIDNSFVNLTSAAASGRIRSTLHGLNSKEHQDVVSNKQSDRNNKEDVASTISGLSDTVTSQQMNTTIAVSMNTTDAPIATKITEVNSNRTTNSQTKFLSNKDITGLTNTMETGTVKTSTTGEIAVKLTHLSKSAVTTDMPSRSLSKYYNTTNDEAHDNVTYRSRLDEESSTHNTDSLVKSEGKASTLASSSSASTTFDNDSVKYVTQGTPVSTSGERKATKGLSVLPEVITASTTKTSSVPAIRNTTDNGNGRDASVSNFTADHDITVTSTATYQNESSVLRIGNTSVTLDSMLSTPAVHTESDRNPSANNQSNSDLKTNYRNGGSIIHDRDNENKVTSAVGLSDKALTTAQSEPPPSVEPSREPNPAKGNEREKKKSEVSPRGSIQRESSQTDIPNATATSGTTSISVNQEGPTGHKSQTPVTSITPSSTYGNQNKLISDASSLSSLSTRSRTPGSPMPTSDPKTKNMVKQNGERLNETKSIKPTRFPTPTPAHDPTSVVRPSNPTSLEPKEKDNDIVHHKTDTHYHGGRLHKTSRDKILELLSKHLVSEAKRTTNTTNLEVIGATKLENRTTTAALLTQGVLTSTMTITDKITTDTEKKSSNHRTTKASGISLDTFSSQGSSLTEVTSSPSSSTESSGSLTDNTQELSTLDSSSTRKQTVEQKDSRNPYSKSEAEPKYLYTGKPRTNWREMSMIKNWLNSALTGEGRTYVNSSSKDSVISSQTPPDHNEGRIKNPYEILRNFKKHNSRLSVDDTSDAFPRKNDVQGNITSTLHTTMPIPSAKTNSDENLKPGVDIKKDSARLEDTLDETSGTRSTSENSLKNRDNQGTEDKSDQQGSLSELPTVKPGPVESNKIDRKDHKENNRPSGNANTNIGPPQRRPLPVDSATIDPTRNEHSFPNRTGKFPTLITQTRGISELSPISSTVPLNMDSANTSSTYNDKSKQNAILHNLLAVHNGSKVDRYTIPDFAIFVSVFSYASDAVKVTWNVSHDHAVSGFRVYYGDSRNETLIEGPALEGTVRTYDVTALITKEKYTFCVVAYLVETDERKSGQCKEAEINFEEGHATVSSREKTKTLALIIGAYGAGALVLVTLLLAIALLVRRYRDKSKTGLYVPRSSPYWIEFLCGGIATSRYSTTVLDSSTTTVSSGVEMSENDSHSDSDESGTYSFDYSLRSLPAQHIWSTADLHTNLYTY